MPVPSDGFSDESYLRVNNRSEVLNKIPRKEVSNCSYSLLFVTTAVFRYTILRKIGTRKVQDGVSSIGTSLGLMPS